MKNDLLKQLSELFKYSTAEHTEQYSDGMNTYKVEIKKEDNQLSLILTKKENKDNKEKLDKFLDSIDDEIWETALENLPKVCNISVKDLNQLYDNGEYDKVLSLMSKSVNFSAKELAAYYKEELDKLIKAYSLNF